MNFADLPDLGTLVVNVLFHFVWQATLVVILAAIVQRAVGLRRPALRYWAGVAGMVVLIAAPIGTSMYLAVNPGMIAGASFANRPVLQPVETTAPITTANPIAPGAPWYAGIVSNYQNVMSWIVSSKIVWLGMWVAGMSVLTVRMMMSWIFCQRIRKKAGPLPREFHRVAKRLKRRLKIKSNILIASSRQVTQAVAIGIVRPMVLIPASWISEMPVQAVEAVLAHELAHIRRWDVLINLLQRIVETVFFFHPAVWWLSKCIRQDREVCCDQLAIHATNKRMVYVETLATVAELRTLQKHVQFGTNFFGGKQMNLLRRIRVALEPNAPANHNLMRIPSVAATFAIALVAIAFLSITARTTISAPANQDEHQRQANQEKHAKHSHKHIEVAEVLLPHAAHGVLHLTSQEDVPAKVLVELLEDDTLADREVAHLALVDLLLHQENDAKSDDVDYEKIAQQLRKLADQISKKQKRRLPKDRPAIFFDREGNRVKELHIEQKRDPKNNKVIVDRAIEFLHQAENKQKLRLPKDKPAFILDPEKKRIKGELHLEKTVDPKLRQILVEADRAMKLNVEKINPKLREILVEKGGDRARKLHVELDPKHNKKVIADVAVDFLRRADEKQKSHKDREQDQDINKVIHDLKRQVEELRKEIKQLRSSDDGRSEGVWLRSRVRPVDNARPHPEHPVRPVLQLHRPHKVHPPREVHPPHEPQRPDKPHPPHKLKVKAETKVNPQIGEWIELKATPEIKFKHRVEDYDGDGDIDIWIERATTKEPKTSQERNVDVWIERESMKKHNKLKDSEKAEVLHFLKERPAKLKEGVWWIERRPESKPEKARRHDDHGDHDEDDASPNDRKRKSDDDRLVEWTSKVPPESIRKTASDVVELFWKPRLPASEKSKPAKDDTIK